MHWLVTTQKSLEGARFRAAQSAPSTSTVRYSQNLESWMPPQAVDPSLHVVGSTNVVQLHVATLTTNAKPASRLMQGRRSATSVPPDGNLRSQRRSHVGPPLSLQNAAPVLPLGGCRRR